MRGTHIMILSMVLGNCLNLEMKKGGVQAH